MLSLDCKYFKGNSPCLQNKKYELDIHCNGCTSYIPVEKNILIIKLWAIGDVIRTTPILHRLSAIYPNSRIYWLTLATDILPKDYIDYILYFNVGSIEVLKNIKFDLLLNLDKSIEACAVAESVKSKIKRGFGLNNGVPFPFSDSANHKYMTGIFDYYSKNNKKHYVEEIFEICDIGEFNNEYYILNNIEKHNNVWNIDRTKIVIGLNTGCSSRWTTRLWPIEYWIELINSIKSQYEVILLGGTLEDNKNKEISLLSGAKYFGVFPLSTFIDLIDNCDLVVSQVTLAAHIAIGLKKKIVLMNNIFNSNEFYLYGLGTVVEPESGCDCFYLHECKRNRHCMKDITVSKVQQAIESLI